MFSQRLAWRVPQNRLSRLLEEKRGRASSILDLTESNPTRVGMDYPAEAIAAALSDPAVASYEPSPRGLDEARAAVAAYYARRGRDVAPDRVVLTASTSEAYSFLFKLLADPGDTFLVPRPSYPLFDYLAGLESVRTLSYPLALDDGWGIDLDALRRQAAAGRVPPRAVVVVNPNNPTGTAVRARERAALEEICTPLGAAIISDEVFFDYLDDRPSPPGAKADRGDRCVSLASLQASDRRAGTLTFALGGLSKACGLPQMKLGWMVVGGPDQLAQEALERIDLIADMYLTVGSPVQRAAPRLLDLGERIQISIRRRIVENLSVLRAAVGPGSPCRVLQSDGGWYAVLQVPAVVPEEDLVLSLLAEDDVLVHPGYFFDFPHESFLVLSLLPEPAKFAEAVRRTLARVAGG